ncbi:MAG TPA: hypothetical protein EYM45_02195 [Verrucomicrobia bacterium]|nr:hypothetical protein [Verrucomicrobiota bacterium]
MSFTILTSRPTGCTNAASTESRKCYDSKKTHPRAGPRDDQFPCNCF